MKKIVHLYPSLEDFKSIFEKYDFKRFSIINGDLKNTNENYDLITKSKIIYTLGSLKINLSNRLLDSQKCFGFLYFYFDKGIPDNECCKSPGNDGQSISFFHHFNDQDFSNKINFDFYTDFFYYKLFSAWDIVGHIINTIFQLRYDDDRVSFKKCICDDLKIKNESLYNELKNIINDPDFIEANKFRNNVSHNLSPNNIRLIAKEKRTKDKITINFEVGKYTKSKEVIDNVYKSFDLMYKTLQQIFVTNNFKYE